MLLLPRSVGLHQGLNLSRVKGRKKRERTQIPSSTGGVSTTFVAVILNRRKVEVIPLKCLLEQSCFNDVFLLRAIF